jgi:hypoxanthine phosphoribosyltransferase
MNKIYINRTDLHGMMNKLTRSIVDNSKKYKSIVGIANGGLAISNCLSYFLLLPHITITIRLRDGKAVDASLDGMEKVTKPFLWVDDIIDSGETLKYFKQQGYIQGVDFDVATLHWCPKNSRGERPDYYVATKEVTDWIVYPWEKEYEETIKAS